ncbi:MAG TPA: class I SAM-dependent methyltransferase [Candidatus Eisenbacteria bacterium]|nr:class I SAM-dependent methyltransferase [Candidatus Eisenbacteria bacterium]
MTYDPRLAADYWSGARHERGDELAAVLSLGEPAAVNRAYDAWETGLLLESLGDRAVARALDLGAGVGRVASRLAPRVERLACADLAPGMLERLRARLRAAGVADAAYDRLRHRADLLPYRDASFDLVVCLGLLEHLPAEARSRALAETARVLRAGGALALVLNNAESRFLGDPNDNPYRVGAQRENGYFCAVVDERALLREAAAWFEPEALGSNVLYSLQRHAARFLPDEARASDAAGAFFGAAERWDRALRPRGGLARVAADHHLYLLRRR